MIGRRTLLLLPFIFACSSAVEPAPFVGGETLSYGDVVAYQLTLEKTPDGFNIITTGQPPEAVGPNLRDGRNPVRAFDLGMIWLEPSQRKIGGQVPLGNVVAEERHQGRQAWKLSERNGRVEYWFDKETGILLSRRVSPAGPVVRLLKSSGVGL